MNDIVLRFYINDQLVDPPKEYKGIELELNYENLDEVLASITADKFTFVNENADILNAYLAAGTTGGLGVFWGVPLRIELDNQILWDGYIDLKNGAQFSCEQVICKVKEKKKLDWMEEYADGFGFDLLYSFPAGTPGRITDADFINIPYILSEIPDYRQAALYFLYVFVIEQEIEGLIKDIGDVLSDLSGFFSTPAGVLKLAVLIAHMALVVAALIALVKQMIENLISDVRYHRGMLYKTHFEKACEHLGLTFQSSLFQDIPTNTYDINGDLIPSAYWANECHIPPKNEQGYKKNGSTTQTGFYVGTFGDFIREMEAKYNAKVTIIGKVLQFERRDYGSSTEVYQIPDVRRDYHGINADEIVSNYLVEFQKDNLDLNTINRYAGTNCKNYITSKVRDTDGTELISGLKRPPITFSLGRRKNELTKVENLVKAFAEAFDIILSPIFSAYSAMVSGVASIVQAFNVFIDILNALPGVSLSKLTVPSTPPPPPSFASTISARIGMLALSSDFIGNQKSVLIEGSGWDVKITTDNETKLSAENLWNKYHFIESFVPSASRPAGNQTYTYEIPAAPFCLEDYYKIRGINNDNKGEAKVISPEGNPAKILSLKWNIWDNKARIKYAEEKLYTDNLQETLLKDS